MGDLIKDPKMELKLNLPKRGKMLLSSSSLETLPFTKSFIWGSKLKPRNREAIIYTQFFPQQRENGTNCVSMWETRGKKTTFDALNLRQCAEAKIEVTSRFFNTEFKLPLLLLRNSSWKNAKSSIQIFDFQNVRRDILVSYTHDFISLTILRILYVPRWGVCVAGCVVFFYTSPAYSSPKRQRVFTLRDCLNTVWMENILSLRNVTAQFSIVREFLSL